MRTPSGTARRRDGPDEADQPDIEPKAVQAQLARILASTDFDASERNRRFLAYIVAEMLAGRGDRIKAYVIGVVVFDRDDSFDAQSDPIVRIEASRLRRSLERYYLLAGKGDPIRLEIPKGGYVPVFRVPSEGERRTAAGPEQEIPAIREDEAPATSTSRARLREGVSRRLAISHAA